ncbi:MAG TPA: alkaline phosphatase D family protein [Gemmatimonadaceae bacterium]
MTSRRDFVAHLSAFGLALAGVPRFPLWIRPRFAANPFTLGVASGDPMPGGVVLWTRLAPDPLNGGGMPSEGVTVRWEVATDDGMRNVVRRGTETARPDLAHSVHAEVGGLDAARWYWYRFDAGGEASPVGRTRTAPATASMPDRFRFAFASCQHYEAGHYTAWRHLSGEEIDLVAHLGDYIYEGATNPNAPPGTVLRPHQAWEPATLAQYRDRYALYKADPDLQAAHAAFPWIVTWDDHEVDNNYAGGISQDNAPRDAFLGRRAAAYQAYYEHQPMRKASIPKGPDMLLYRTIGAGQLARFHVLDTRQYRSDQSCGDGLKRACPEWSDASRVMLGDTQERWLTRGVEQSQARWNVLAQQLAFSRIPDPNRPDVHAMDPWSGYPAARDRLLQWMAARQQKNFVVLTGDIHANFVMDVKQDAMNPSSSTVATEFIGTSITSGRNGSARWPSLAQYETTVPGMRYHSNRRGYVRCEITADAWHADYRTVPYVMQPGAPIETAASFVVEQGRAGAHKV